MGPSNLFFTSASPLVVLPPPSQHPSFSRSTDSHFADRQVLKRSSSSFNPWLHSFSFSAPLARPQDTPHSTAINSTPRGRKRCRDEEAEGGDDPVTPSIVQPGALNGEDMMMAQPDRSLVKDGIQQGEIGSGELNRTPQSAFINSTNDTVTNRLVIPRRKLQRLHTTPSVLTNPTSTHHPLSSTTPALTDPPIDTFTLRLGIGWTNLNHQPDKRAALRGWARYIEKNFPGLTNAQILLQSKRLNDAFLVSTDQGFFLFDEEMSRGRLVGRTEERALMNLAGATAAAPGSTGMGVVFDGEELVRGGRVGAGTAMRAGDDDISVAVAPRASGLQGEVTAQGAIISSSMNVTVNDNHAHGENRNMNGDGAAGSTTSTSTPTIVGAAPGALMDLD